MVVQFLQEVIGGRLPDILMLAGLAQQRDDVRIQLDRTGDRGVARYLAIDGSRQDIELMAGGTPHPLDAVVLGYAIGKQPQQQQDNQQQRQSERAVRLGQGCRQGGLGAAHGRHGKAWMLKPPP